MHVTCGDIARSTGLSVATVSRVLNGTYRRIGISDASARRVREAAAAMGYQPNAAARATVTGRFGCIGLLRGDHYEQSQITEPLLGGIHGALERHKLRLSIDIFNEARLDRETRMPSMLRSWSIDGILVNYTYDPPDSLNRFLTAHRMPVVWLNADRPHNAVLPDDYEAGKMAVEKLLSLGHRRIAYANTTRPEDEPERRHHYSAFEREEGYVAAMREAGLEPCVWRPATLRLSQETIRDCRGWLARTPRPTAVVAYERFVAAPLLAAAYGAGLRVPADLSIVCFSDGQLGDLYTRFSSFVIPNVEMAARAVEMLLAKQSVDSAEAVASLRLPFGFDHGETLAPPASGGGVKKRGEISGSSGARVRGLGRGPSPKS